MYGVGCDGVCVCGVAPCLLPCLPLYLEIVVEGGVLLCAYSCTVLVGLWVGLVGYLLCGSYSHRGVHVRVQHFASVPLCFGGGARHRLPPLLFPCVPGCSPGGPFSMSFLLYALCSVFLYSRDVFSPSLVCSLCAGVVPCRVQHVLWGLSAVESNSPCGVAIESFISYGRCWLGCTELRLFGLHVFSCVCL